jgi:predicted amidohydrolase
MNAVRIAPAKIERPTSPEDSMVLAKHSIAHAATERAGIICFPKCFVPGYRVTGKAAPPPGAAATAKTDIAVAPGREQIVDGALLATAVSNNRDGPLDGFLDKLQLHPAEERHDTPGTGRRVFQTGPLVCGVVIGREGWRYPETLRWAVQRGARIVFHPHFHEAEPRVYRPLNLAEPANTLHEKSALCRSAGNTCFLARQLADATLLAYQPYGLMADLEISEATALLAARFRGVQLPD